jgi:uncharacterized protein (TIGR02145 family)
MKSFYKITVLMMICFFITNLAFAELTADFSADQTIVMAGNPIQFTDLSTGNPTSWEWDFENDGTIDSYEQNPEWTYSEIGMYSVSLTVSDGTNEDTELKEDYISVIEAQAPILISATPGWGTITLLWEPIPGTKTNHFNFEGGNPADAVWTIYIGGAKIAGEDMEAGDEIGIHDGDLLVGAFTLDQVCTPENQFDNTLKAFAEIFSGPGYTQGNPFAFVAWDESEQTESIEFEYTFSNPYGDAYTGDVFPQGDAPYSIAQLAFNEIGYMPTFIIYLEDGTLVEAEVQGNSYVDYITPIGEYCYYITQIMECGIESNPSNIECVVCPPPPRAIYGNISGLTGKIEGAQVVLEGTSYSAISNKYGRYCIFDIDPGTYDITASAEGYSPETIYNMVIEENNFSPINFFLLRMQNFELEFGFQFISSNIIPGNPDMLIVMADILNDNFSFARNSQGQTLRKIGPNWVNGIGDWIIDEGYLVKMNADDSFSIEGLLVDPTTPIPVEIGFQFVSYFPENSMDAMLAFEAIIGDDLDFIRGSEGTMIRKIGPNWINGIGDCQSGEGYLVKMFAEDVLVYPGSSSFTCGDPFTDPRDEQTYETVEIGDQCWIAENLNIGTMINGGSNMTNNGIIEKYCFNNDPANCEIYGGLYQWNEMMDYVTVSATQGICPEGWYLPTDFEWKVLEGTVDSQYPVGDPEWDDTGWRGYDAGENLKSTTYWYQNTGTDLFGFTALPGGYYHGANGTFNNLTNSGFFWSSSEYSSSDTWHRYFYFNNDKVVRNNSNKGLGYSVRCLQDNPIVNTNEQGSFDNLSSWDIKRSYELSGMKRKNNGAVQFAFEGGNPAEAVYTLYIKGLEIGNEVAAYDGDKMVGSTRINSQNAFENELPVFSTLINGQGYKEGNPITFKVFSENNIVAADFTMEAIYDSYVSDVYPEGDGKYSVVNITKGSIEIIEESISVYPNPSKGLFNISLQGIKGNIQIKVLDLKGKEYTNFELNGSTSTQLDLRDLPAGVYFISFSGNDFCEVKKIVIK